MKNKVKKYRKRCIAFAALLAVMVLAAVSVSAGEANKAATSKPGAVKNLKKVKVTKNSIKVKYKNVKGASGYKIYIYERFDTKGRYNNYLTPLVYVKKTKKTTYTIKNLVPGCKYTIKVCAYNKDGTCGKKQSIKVSTHGIKTDFIACNSCRAAVPYYRGNNRKYDYTYWAAEHIKSAWNELGELHGGTTLN